MMVTTYHKILTVIFPNKMGFIHLKDDYDDNDV
jgi:hypothetical protein